MGWFGETKYERKLTDLLLRLFGSGDARCMNLGNIRGLLTQIESRVNERISDLKEEVSELREEIEELKKQKRKAVRKKK